MNDQLSKLLHQLSEQHARDGHIDSSLVERFFEDPQKGSVSPSPTNELDAKLIRRIAILQAHLLSDLQRVMDSSPNTARVDECVALNTLLRRYLES